MSGDSVRERLARLLATRPGEIGTVDPGDLRSRLRKRLREQKAEPPAGLEPAGEGSVLARRTAFDGTHRHGAWQLAEALDADTRTLALLGRDPALAGVDLSRALFLDTETSGLSGGSGTWVFLVGLGRFAAGDPGATGFEIWQGFLEDPAGERALLAEVAARIRGADLVVSFFGKSFDRHRLEDKMRIHGIDPPFPGRPHLDLYYPLRRLYRPRASPGSRGPVVDGRLKTFELELCGVEREDDLPGALAPAAWFDFLHGRAHDLEGVFRHNRDDVLSLVTLAAHLARTLEETRRSGEPLSGSGSARARAVAAALALENEASLALAWFERARERAAGPLSRTEERLSRRVRRLA